MNIFQKLISRKTQKSTTLRDNYGNILSTFGAPNTEYLEINTYQDVKKAYTRNAIIYAIVEKKAQLFSKIEIKELTASGEPIIESIFLEKMKQPNGLIGENEFLLEIGRQLALYRNCIIYVNRALPRIPLTKNDKMEVLDFASCEIIYKNNINRKNINSIYEIIEKIRYTDEIQNTIIEFSPLELIFISFDGIFKKKNEIYLKAAEEAINLINSKYSLLNSLYSRNGGFGIFSNPNGGVNNDFFNNNLSEEEKNELQAELAQYNFNRKGRNFIITSKPLQYQHISYPIRDLEIESNTLRAITDIANVMNFEILSLNSLDGSTFNNKENSDKNLINNAIIPMWDIVETVLQKEKLTNNTILFDYSNIPELQQDNGILLENMKKQDEIWINRWKNGIITYNEMRTQLGLEEVQNGDYYYQEKNNINDDTIPKYTV